MLLPLLSFLIPTLALALPVTVDPSPQPSSKPAYFLLAGDSTTAKPKDLSTGITGGWGDGFLALLVKPASGVNYGHNGRTTVNFRSGGDWGNVMKDLKAHKETKDVYVTIQFGHNDFKSVSLPDFQKNLETMAKEVKAAGGTPILTTPLSQRYFTAGKLRETLSAQAQATIAAAKSGDTIFIDLHAESMKYLTSIGEAEANTLSANEKDKTHLSTKGTKVFGGIVADLIAAGIPALKGVFVK